ncbi:hypothetical protein GCM10022198_20550 [Klugiella xanthotipulae]|uniref:regulatory protein RecX n=1 Tax=Klugiella xanthotipulae TaxID=244735 RepID=UPI0014769802|nr:RecX family transcriptional regulator [Klugiella xanthotipulae]
MTSLQARRGAVVSGVRAYGGTREEVSALPAVLPGLRTGRSSEDATVEPDDYEGGFVPPTHEEIETRVLARLARKQLSEEETRRALREEGADENQAEDLLADFCGRGYVNDATLAEVLVEKLLGRKKQGPSVIRRELAQRGLPDHIIAAALEVIDEDAEQQLVLDAAVDRARRLGSLERDVAERRLTAYLIRRGYSSGMVRDAVRKALGPSRKGSGSVTFR